MPLASQRHCDSYAYRMYVMVMVTGIPLAFLAQCVTHPFRIPIISRIIGDDEGDGHATGMRQASEGHASGMPITITYTLT